MSVGCGRVDAVGVRKELQTGGTRKNSEAVAAMKQPSTATGGMRSNLPAGMYLSLKNFYLHKMFRSGDGLAFLIKACRWCQPP